MNKTQLVLLAAYALLGFSAHAQNLLVNGSFEAGAFSDSGNGTQQLLAGSTDMSGWTVMTDDVAWITNANPFGVTASEGVMCLDLTGYTDAALRARPPRSRLAQSAVSTLLDWTTLCW
jgi:hypothetical protein